MSVALETYLATVDRILAAKQWGSHVATGDDAVDGYSEASAREAWQAGATVPEYLEIVGRKRGLIAEAARRESRQAKG